MSHTTLISDYEQWYDAHRAVLKQYSAKKIAIQQQLAALDVAMNLAPNIPQNLIAKYNGLSKELFLVDFKILHITSILSPSRN